MLLVHIFEIHFLHFLRDLVPALQYFLTLSASNCPQGLPATCPGLFTYAIKTTAYDERETEVNYTDTSCSSSACGDDVLVGQQAHKLNLTVFRDGNQLAEESVYVPALEESEL